MRSCCHFQDTAPVRDLRKYSHLTSLQAPLRTITLLMIGKPSLSHLLRHFQSELRPHYFSAPAEVQSTTLDRQREMRTNTTLNFNLR